MFHHLAFLLRESSFFLTLLRILSSLSLVLTLPPAPVSFCSYFLSNRLKIFRLRSRSLFLSVERAASPEFDLFLTTFYDFGASGSTPFLPAFLSNLPMEAVDIYAIVKLFIRLLCSRFLSSARSVSSRVLRFVLTFVSTAPTAGMTLVDLFSFGSMFAIVFFN